ncbi:MAG TPA: hypothetical protein VIK84_00185 [Haloplasmataceae bacterium]
MQNKPKSLNSFIKGMNKNLDNLSRPKDSYYNAKNFVNIDKEGLLFNLTNERGTINKETFTSTERPGDVYRIIGHTVLNDQVIVFGVSMDNLHSEIGVFDINDNYTTILNNDELNFKIEHQIDAEARVFFNGDRVVYFTDNYNPIRVVNLDNPPTSNIDENTSSYPNRRLPYVNYLETLESGTLKTGCYLFTVRYLDSNLNTTPFGPVCNPIPVVDDTRDFTTLRNTYDGAPIDTNVNKSLRLEIKNVDTNFKYIEIVVIYYEGDTRQRVIRSAGLLEITGSTMEFTYDLSLSNDRNIQIDIEEISQEPVFYNKAKCVTQKDGILVYSNLSSDTELDDFQKIANRITVEYQIEEVLFNEAITITPPPFVSSTYAKSDTSQSAFLDYKNEELTFNKKGYMRDEVYSLGIQFVYKNGAKSLVYHIPGTDKTTLGNNITATVVNSTEANNNIGNRTGQLGTYISTLTYPSGSNYPGVSGDYDVTAGYQDNYIRHHKMPSLSQEPHFRQSGGKEYIRILGLKFSNINIPPDIAEKLQGYIIHRELRNENSKRSIVCQGICHPMLEFINNSPATGADVDIPYICPNYFFGNTYIAASTRVSFHSGDTPSRLNDMFAFYSPDTIISQINLNPVNKIKPVLSIEGTVNLVVGIRHDYDAPKNGLLHLFCNYNNYSILGGISEKTVEIKSYETNNNDSGSAKVLDANYGVYSGKRLYNYDNQGYTLLKITETDLLNPGTTGGVTDVSWEFRSDGDSDDLDDIYVNGTSINYLYNLLINNNSQYSNIYSAQYTPIYFQTTVSNTTVENVYGGDTYISKFAFKNCGRVKWDVRHGANTWITATPLANRGSLVGTEMRGLSYFFVESEINTEYRHTVNTPVDYYPKSTIISDLSTIPGTQGILDKDPSFGEANSYNDLYSKSNDIVLYFPKPLAFQSVSSYPNRSIFSEQSIEGEQSDSYKVFKADNYFDIPKNTGEIWNTFVHNNKFYIHTPGSLWLAPFNDRTLISNETNSESFMTGTSGVFTSPAIQIFTLDEGYAGTQSQWCNINTPYGCVFIDNNQRKIFLLGEGLKEISFEGMSSWFFENLNISNLADNPANPSSNGFLGVYDNLNKRILITKKDGINSFTISYSFINNAWISYHDYLPNYYIQKSDSFYSIINENTVGERGILWEHNKGDFGVFYNRTPSVSEIEFTVNEGSNIEKVFDNQEIYCDIYDEGLGRYVHRDFFDTIQIYNNYQNTEQVNLILSDPQGVNDNVKLKKNHYQVAIPRDQVLDANSNIFDSANLTSSLALNDPLRKFRPRIKSKWINVKLRYLNTNNYRLTLRQVLTYFRQIFR